MWKGENWEYTVALTTGMPHQFYYDNHGEIPWGLIETLRMEEPGLIDTFNVKRRWSRVRWNIQRPSDCLMDKYCSRKQ